MMPGMDVGMHRGELGHGTGPLRGVRVVEIAGLGPAPHACMLLADLGADVIRVDRPGGNPMVPPGDLLNRGRPSVAVDLKCPDGVEAVLRLVDSADVLVEGLRPGVLERLGLGPEDCRARNPRLVYGRMTGWGQDGPLATAAGHDMNYISVSGALYGLGQDGGRPHFPSNLLGDFGGGSMYLVVGVLAAVLEARTTGRGQVVDAAIVDGTAHLNMMASAWLHAGRYDGRRARNLLDGGAPFYDLYETSDGEHVSVGPLEPQFYAELLRLLGVEETAPDRTDPAQWGALRELLASTFRQRTQAEWVELFEGTDACVAGVVPLAAAPEHPHLAARGTFVEIDGAVQPAPAPRFSRTPGEVDAPPAPSPGAHTREALAAWGVADVDALIELGAAVQD